MRGNLLSKAVAVPPTPAIGTAQTIQFPVQPPPRQSAPPVRKPFVTYPTRATSPAPSAYSPAPTNVVEIADDYEPEPVPVPAPPPRLITPPSPLPQAISQDVPFTKRHAALLRALSIFRHPISYWEGGQWCPLPLPPPEPSLPLFSTKVVAVPALEIPLTNPLVTSPFTIVVVWYLVDHGVLEMRDVLGVTHDQLSKVMGHSLSYYYMRDAQAKQLWIDPDFEQRNFNWNGLTQSKYRFPFLTGTDPWTLQRAGEDDPSGILRILNHLLAQTKSSVLGMREAEFNALLISIPN
jgi:hypothetical protein